MPATKASLAHDPTAVTRVRASYVQEFDVVPGDRDDPEGHAISILQCWKRAGAEGTVTLEHGGEKVTYEAV